MTRLISSANAAIENIRAYENFVADNPDLINRLAKHRAWYAVRDGDAWRFGNSKIIGYADITPDKYLSGGLDGRQTEAVLREWFTKVERSDPNYVELRESLARFLEVYKKSPSKLARVNVLKNEVASVTEKNAAAVCDLIFEVAKRLDADEIKELMKRLKKLQLRVAKDRD